LKHAFAVCLALVPLAGFTEVDGVRIYDQSLDLMIDAPAIVGKKVRVSGVVFTPSLSSAGLKIDGGQLILQPPWQDRGDFRKLVPACEVLRDAPQCRVTVTGTVVDLGETIKIPVLKDVDFVFPGDP
jgi:hypothetical protein